ncbi:polysaccharide biosynthesis tyrosine autokinase [Paenibacillaceae bacterium]|nr:polysaccharide biosynthesis tyrosine autokinase [Paenibacillaceae bacterium]
MSSNNREGQPMRQSAASQSIIMQMNPESEGAEPYRSLRTTIEYAAATQGKKVFMVTSAKKGEGKSTVAANLALSIAQTGKNTVLVDANLRNPTQNIIMGTSNHFGLSSYLEGQTDREEDIVKSSTAEQLAIVPAGPQPVNPAELLTKERMDSLLELLKTEYDYVIVDTPSLLSATDPQIIATRADGVIMVVEHRKLSQAHAKQAVKHLSTVNAKLIGVVFNKQKQ